MSIEIGDVHDSHGVAAGDHSSANNVTINNHSVAPPVHGEPPEPPVKEQIRSIRIAVLSLNQMMVELRVNVNRLALSMHLALVVLSIGVVLALLIRIAGWW